ncbi:ABC transporter substrate-binding protein [Klebsiella pneumoniae]|uniref:ABC transporter substrate-binding protein n=7 Tax=Klebsiella pneumoniae TaxID=573 RepID=A0A919LR07_KLEPN|nr:ABC transporter substrate-binding protein [Klebsiella pneumoniae]
MTLVLSAFAMSAHAALDLRANEQPLPVTRDPQAIAKIPPGYRFVEPGTLTVAISALNSPPLALLASDNRTRIGSDPDIARLLAGSLGLKLRLVPTAWEDWPLGIASGRYDVALINIAVTEKRKEKFDFATYRVDSLAFSVKSTSDIVAVNGPADLAGRKVIVGSGTNQERILLGWNEDNRAAGRPQAQPVYLTDDASGNLYIQSGRADIFFGPQSVAAYKAALNGQTRVVGPGPKAWVATTTKKATVWSMPCRQPSTGRLPAVNISRCWRVGGAGRSGGAVGGQPAGDNLLTPSGMVCRVGERQISAYT